MIDPRKLCQIEFPTEDLDAAITFYEVVLGWPTVPIEIHRYVVLQTPKDCPYGISLVPSHEEIGQGPVLYFKSEGSLALDQVEALGGRLVFRDQRLPGYGVITMIEDPSGNRIGFFNKSLD
ncbi:VOC family protein [Pseudobacteriovorax antillogorgiicola]|uniref:VOC domain-containing protein n=1 Tax=Pseudobacteriovorax antillogorgiicola TaxID=1513793 RepID=A0A1Y6CHY8_9BACT|nr:VOC family protein [Pseudobacteriovorax antillogorgiicola]TCS46687.1 putative enzyme related to lactoylglutathione lyase [Pseudobacteriovorax antillogorgiicola]SMF66741.1 hypothetical protein SAMN06296036_12363 [Pseudobacteriovorax antillogorgiicola]